MESALSESDRRRLEYLAAGAEEVTFRGHPMSELNAEELRLVCQYLSKKIKDPLADPID